MPSVGRDRNGDAPLPVGTRPAKCMCEDSGDCATERDTIKIRHIEMWISVYVFEFAMEIFNGFSYLVFEYDFFFESN